MSEDFSPVPIGAGAAGRICFVSDRDGNDEIYVMDADGSGQTRLTNSSATNWAPAWSPDGARIAYMSDPSLDHTYHRHWQIHVINADGSGQRPLTAGVSWSWQPAWSPNGALIAFSSYRSGNQAIYLMNSDGTDQKRLEPIGWKPKLANILKKINPVDPRNKSGGDGSPAWSPDGAFIAFASDRDSFFEKIYRMNADGSGRRLLTDTPSNDDPVWSPDGGRIAFQSARDGNFQIYVMDADGSDQRRLTHNSSVDGEPTWSPDGSKLAFSSRMDGSDEIYVMNADGSGQVNISNSPDSNDQMPAWGP